MAEVLRFVPRTESRAHENLAAFVQLCRTRLTALGEHIRFDDDVWDVTEAVPLKGKNGALRLVFSNWATTGEQNPVGMAEPFRSFAKAYMRYQHAVRPTKSVGQRMVALRALEAALQECRQEASPTACSPDVLNRAAQMIGERFSAGVAYRAGGQLEMLSEFLSVKRLCATTVRWRNPIGRPHTSVRIGKEFDERRQAKLPSPAALGALARVFRLASEPPDVLVSSVLAILCASPGRVNEALGLKVACEVFDRVPTTGELTYGLSWNSSKGATPTVKWVVPSMADVVKEAVRRIREQTEEAREVARWYEVRPTDLFLPANLEHLRGHVTLDMTELCEVLFKEPSTPRSARDWCRAHKVKITRVGERYQARFADVERVIVAMLPRGFPIADAERRLRYSEALCLILRQAMHRTKATYRGAIDLLEQGDVHMRIGGAPASRDSIFSRFGFTEEDGTPIRLTSHQFRHYLNTLAQRGGLSQLDIAKWSGRVDVSQNRAYDHESARDVLARLGDLVANDAGPSNSIVRSNRLALIPRDEFAWLGVLAAHTTEFGFCIHDFTMLPCQIHRDCVNCDEQVCIKGDEAREASVRRHRAETRALLHEAETASVDGECGANRWLEHQRLTLERLDQLCAIFDDPKVPAGAAIQLSRLVPASRISQARTRQAQDGEVPPRIHGRSSASGGHS